MQADGSVGKPRVLLEPGSSERGIEGIAVDDAGNIFACGGSGNTAAIHVLAPSGELIAKQRSPADMPMRLAFGGADRSSLYLTTGGGHLYSAR